MGNFYTNITLTTAQQPAVVNALQSAGREALVSEPRSGCIVVYDRENEEQDIEELNRLASSLSGALRCAALAVLDHDDDVLVVTLHENGKMVDEYVSAPRYFDSGDFGEPEGGDAKRLCRAFGADAGAASVAEVERVLRMERAGDGDHGYVFEVERHEALVKALGLPGVAVGAGYNYIDAGELPEGTTETSFTRVG